jgi:lambda family phage portal protein
LIVASQRKLALARIELQTEILRTFEAAKKSRRTENWFTTNRGPNADIKAALPDLMSRCQDLVDNDSWSARAVSIIVNNAVGVGIQGAPNKGTKAYGRGWNEWAHSTDCDFYGKSNFFGLQRLALRTCATRGSVLVRKHINPEMWRKHGMVPLQLQLLEPDWLDTTRDDGAKIVGGKVFDKYGRWEGAFLWDQHPGETGISALRLTSTYVPKSELLHIYEMRRPGQYTGIPWGTAALIRSRDISDYDAAELLKQKLAACFAAFVTDNDLESDEEGDELTDTIEPGLLQRLKPGQSVIFSDPPKVDDNGAFIERNLRAVAAAWGVTYEALTGNLSDVNFSSGRMGWLEFNRNVGGWRYDLLIPQLLDPVGYWYQETAQIAASGRLPRGMIWTPPRREMIQPKEEIAYLIDAVKAGFISLSEVQRSFGFVPLELLDELSIDLREARARGLALSVDGQMDVGRMQARAFAEQQKANGARPPAGGDSTDDTPPDEPPPA